MRLFLFFIFILYAGKRALACEIEFDPKEVFVKFGGSASAICKTSGCNSATGMGWESSYGGTGLEEGVSTLELKIEKIVEWTVEPKCYIAFSNDEQKTEKLPMTIYKMPEKVSMPKPTTPMKVTGEYYLIQCDVVDVAPANKLVISWYKGNEKISEKRLEDPSRKPVNESFQSTIEVLPEDNGKKVWCEAKLNLPAEQSPPPMRSEAHVLTVFYPPTFTEPKNKTLEIDAGTEISLNCTATGNPIPVYSWHFKHPTEGEIQRQNVTGPIFTVTPEFRVSGVYSCVASNNVGKTTKYFILNKPKGNLTTMAVLLGVFLALGAVIIIVGAIFVTENGSCAFQKGIYHPTASDPL
ncbi:vascular cell adhesion protein 1-like [Anableps anableps]